MVMVGTAEVSDAANLDSGRVIKQPRGSLAPPTRIGRYALFGQIGAGGMGVVLLGKLLGSAGFERIVAIKRVHPLMVKDDKFLSMFRRELRLLARVRHPNVIAALDVAEVDHELLLVMEYVHGESLAALLREATTRGEPISPELAVTIASGVLNGLHAAHVATSPAGTPLDIIHRDVSPHNVLVGCDGLTRVVDFGVARSAGERQVTRVGELRGKPGYLAPEQIRGESVTHRADIYSLSVVLWEMLASRRLFSSKSLTATIDGVLRGNVPSLSSLLKRPFPDRLEAIVRQGLSRDPADRFATARDMAAALEAEIHTLPLDQVGDWVSRIAQPALEERERQLAWAESCPIAALTPELQDDAADADLDVATLLRPLEAGGTTREFAIGELAPATVRPASLPPLPRLPAPLPAQPAATVAPAPPEASGKTRRRLLYGVTAIAAVVVLANSLTDGALFGRHEGPSPVRPSPPVEQAHDEPTTGAPSQPPARRAQPQAPVIEVTDLPKERTPKNAKPAPAPTSPPPADDVTATPSAIANETPRSAATTATTATAVTTTRSAAAASTAIAASRPIVAATPTVKSVAPHKPQAASIDGF
jgi:hypothetical protein